MSDWLRLTANPRLAAGHARVPAALLQRLTDSDPALLLVRVVPGDGSAAAVAAATAAGPPGELTLSPAMLTAMGWLPGTRVRAHAQPAGKLPHVRRITAAVVGGYEAYARAAEAAEALESVLLQQLRCVRVGFVVPLVHAAGTVRVRVAEVTAADGRAVSSWARLDASTEVTLVPESAPRLSHSSDNRNKPPTSGETTAASERSSGPMCLRLRALRLASEDNKRTVMRAYLNLPSLVHAGDAAAATAAELRPCTAATALASPRDLKATRRPPVSADRDENDPSGDSTEGDSAANPRGATSTTDDGPSRMRVVQLRHDASVPPGHVRVPAGVMAALALPHGAPCILHLPPAALPTAAAREAAAAAVLQWALPQSVPLPALDTVAGHTETAMRLTRTLHHTLWPDAAAQAARAPTTLGCLVSGLRGVGKTHVAEMVLQALAASASTPTVAVRVDCKQLLGKPFSGRVADVRHALREGRLRQPAVVFLDDLDLLIPASQDGEHSGAAAEAEAAALLLHDVIATALHGCSDRRLCVLTTCESPAALHSALAGPRLWGTVETLAAPDRDGRAALLAVLLAGAVQGDRGYNSKRGCDCAGNSECECDSDCDDLTTLVDMLALRTDGYVASDLSAVVAAARQAVAVTDFSAASSTASNGLQRMELLAAALETALATHSPLHLSSLGATRVQVTLEDVGGMDEAKEMLTEVLAWPLLYPELMGGLPMKQPAGALLYGPSGCGKTLLAQAIAGEHGLRFVSIKGPELLNKYIGASERAVRELFARAQAAAPCVLFFDELEAIAPPRGQSSSGVTDRVVNQLLTHLDGIESRHGVYVLAATSRPDLVDPALLRPGRLDVAVCCEPPDTAARTAILAVHTRALPLAADVDLSAVAAITAGCTGADLRAVVTDAQLAAIQRLGYKRREEGRNSDDIGAEGSERVNTEMEGLVVDAGVPLYRGNPPRPVGMLPWPAAESGEGDESDSADEERVGHGVVVDQALLLAAAASVAHGSQRQPQSDVAQQRGSRVTLA